MSDNQQTMITIKKADGTTERITLAQLKERQAQKKSPAQPTVSFRAEPQKGGVEKSLKSLSEPRDPSAPPHFAGSVGMTTRHVAPPTPPKPAVKLPHPPAKPTTPKLDAEDFASPFDDEPDVVKADLPKLSAPRGIETADIIGKISFKVPEAYQNRLRGIIQLRLKDIRSEEDTRELVSRSIKDGGLGLTEGQAEDLMTRIKHGSKIDSSVRPDVRRASDGMTAAAALPMIELEMEPATVAPFNSFIHQDNSVRKPRTMGNFSKPQMDDIISKPKEMGPLEEILYFTLIDFRRLSDNPAEAASRLWQKFINLKEESILLYFEAVKNWHLSPFYADYLKVISTAIAKKQKLASVIGEKNQIQLSEIQALIEMEKRLE